RRRPRVDSNPRGQQGGMRVSQQLPKIPLAELVLPPLAPQHVAGHASGTLQGQRALAALDVTQHFALLHDQRAGALSPDNVPDVSGLPLRSIESNVAEG